MGAGIRGFPRDRNAAESSPWHALPVLAVILGALALYFWPLILRGEHAVPFHFEPTAVTGMATEGAPRTIHERFPDHDDSPVLVAYPNAALAGAALRRGELPLWNPYAGCGSAAMAGGQVFPFSPFLWPFYAFPGPAVYTLCLALQVLWLALGAWVWLGRLVPSPWPRLAGALVCAFNPWTAKLFIFSSMGAACWLGWILWGWDQALDARRGGWWIPALMIALSALCGHPEVAILMAAASACYAAASWISAGKGRLPAAGFLASCGATVLLSAALSAVQWMPVLWGLPESASYKFQGEAANLTPGHYLLTDVFNPRSPVFVNPPWWGLLFLGLVAILRNRRLWPVAALLAVSVQLCFWTLSFGPLVGLQTLGGFLPGIYARGALWVSLGATAAAGVALLWDGGGERWLPARVLVVGLLAFAGLSWADYQQGSMIHLLIRRDLMAYYGAVSALLVGTAVLRPGFPRRWALAAVLTALVASPMVDGGFRYPYFNATRPEGAATPAVGALRLTEVDPHGRMAGVLGASSSRPCLSPNLATLWGLRDARVLDVLQNRRLWRLQDALGADRKRLLRTFVAFPGAPDRAWEVMGVGRLAVPDGSMRGGVRWESLPGSRPRAFVAHEVTPAADEDASQAAVKARMDGASDGTVVLEGWAGARSLGAPSGRDSVSWEEDAPARVRMRVDSADGGVLVLLDTFAEGWRAEVDGIPARIYPADLAFRGVVLEPGRHEVTFRYGPRSLPLGLGLSGIGLVVAAWGALRRRPGVAP